MYALYKINDIIIIIVKDAPFGLMLQQHCVTVAPNSG